MYPIDPPISEAWSLDEFPDLITIEGREFRRAVRKQPYDGCIEQYRETVPRESMHLLVMNNGMWVIDHVDEYNPDMGHPFRHFLVDHPRGKGVVVAGAGAAGLIASALVGVAQKGKGK